MAQPPLSQQIRQFEDELGFELFQRTKRRVQLTDAGRVFLDESRSILNQLDEAVKAAQRASRGEQGEIAIGFVSSASYSILPPLLRQFRHACPGVHVVLQELTTDQQIERLRDKQIDVGFVRPPIEDPDLTSTTILKEPLVVALPERHPLTQSGAIALSTLASESFILFPRPLAPGLYDQVIGLCQKARFSPKVVQEAIQMQTIVSLVAADIGIAIVPRSLQNLQRTGVVYKELTEPTPEAAIALAWRRDVRSPVVQRFLDLMGTLMNNDASAPDPVLAP